MAKDKAGQDANPANTNTGDETAANTNTGVESPANNAAVEQLQKKLDQANSEKAMIEKKLEESNAVIAEMQEQIDEQSESIASGKSKLTVVVDKRKYEIRVPGKVKFRGKEYTAKAIAESKDVAAEMVKVKASFLVAVEK